MSDRLDSHQIALYAVQKVIEKLVIWSDASLPKNCKGTASKALLRSQEILGWNETAEIKPLMLLFNDVNLTQTNGLREKHWYPVKAIADKHPTIPYPTKTRPTELELQNIQSQIRDGVAPLLEEHWNNLSFLLMVLEKYGSCLSFDESNVALIDFAKAMGSIAAALRDDSDASAISLVAGDLSGIQSFIYTIASDGALKSLRARSFYLELVTEEVVQQLLETLALSRCSVIYAGGGNFYLLAPIGVEQQVQEIGQKINTWLKDDFQGKVFLSIAYQALSPQDVASDAFAKIWSKVIEKVNYQKTLKFSHQLDQVLEIRRSYIPCKVCYRDDEEDLQPLNARENDSPLACPSCRHMFHLGGKLLNAHKFVRSRNSTLTKDPICFDLQPDKIYYHLFEGQKNVNFKEDTLLLVNDWTIDNFQRPNTIQILLGNYGKGTEKEGEEGFMTASEFANQSVGIKRVGYLRMDVDRLGQIFVHGLRECYSLPSLAGLSRQMSYFFKVYLNSLAEFRERELIPHINEFGFKILTSKKRKNLLFIYAGGDDLFVSGSWDQVVEFAFDVYQTFRAYTGNNPDITLSGGVSLEVPKFPLYQAASSAGEAEENAKGNDRDSLGLFGEAFKWREWLGTVSIDDIVSNTKGYLSVSDRPPLLGIWEFVHLFRNDLYSYYNRSFVRNLLLTAQIQEKQLEEKRQVIANYRKNNQKDINDAIVNELRRDANDIQHYLHLPKIAYTLARLPSELRQHEKFKPMRVSLLSPFNARYFRAIATWIELLTRPS